MNIDNNVVIERIKKTLESFDSNVDTRISDLLENCINQIECWEYSPCEVVEGLTREKDLPQIVWDLIVDLYNMEIADGNPDAMNNLGALYYEGQGVPQSFEKAVYYYNIAAENGSRQAQENLGYCYYYGRNMDIDYKKAFHYFALGAFDGHLISLYKIGDMYANGYYVDKNEKEAFLIYQHCEAMLDENNAEIVAGPIYLRLGNAYLYGRGTDVDAKLALKSFQQAELYLYDMVKNGDVMYKKSLEGAINGQIKARELLSSELPDKKWTFDE